MVPLKEMWIWNYNENNHAGRSDGVPPHYYWTASGMRDVVIQSSLTGSEDPADWQTVYEGDISCAMGQGEAPVDLRVDFGGADARYVVITSKPGGRVNWVEEKVNQTGHIDVGWNAKALDQMLSTMLSYVPDPWVPLSIVTPVERMPLIDPLEAAEANRSM